MKSLVNKFGFGTAPEAEDDFDDIFEAGGEDSDYQALEPVESARDFHFRPTPSTNVTRMPLREVAPVDMPRIVTAHLESFDEVAQVGKSFREGTPIILNLSDLNDAEVRRVVDFMSGMVYALDGKMEQVTNRVLLMSPKSVTVDRAQVSSRTRGF